MAEKKISVESIVVPEKVFEVIGISRTEVQSFSPQTWNTLMSKYLEYIKHLEEHGHINEKGKMNEEIDKLWISWKEGKFKYFYLKRDFDKYKIPKAENWRKRKSEGFYWLALAGLYVEGMHRKKEWQRRRGEEASAWNEVEEKLADIAEDISKKIKAQVVIDPKKEYPVWRIQCLLSKIEKVSPEDFYISQEWARRYVEIYDDYRVSPQIYGTYIRKEVTSIFARAAVRAKRAHKDDPAFSIRPEPGSTPPSYNEDRDNLIVEHLIDLDRQIVQGLRMINSLYQRKAPEYKSATRLLNDISKLQKDPNSSYSCYAGVEEKMSEIQ